MKFIIFVYLSCQCHWNVLFDLSLLTASGVHRVFKLWYLIWCYYVTMECPTHSIHRQTVQLYTSLQVAINFILWHTWTRIVIVMWHFTAFICDIVLCCREKEKNEKRNNNHWFHFLITIFLSLNMIGVRDVNKYQNCPQDGGTWYYPMTNVL